MRTYDEVTANVLEGARRHRQKIRKMQYTLSVSAVCVVCMMGLTIYMQLEKPETIPPDQQTYTTTVQSDSGYMTDASAEGTGYTVYSSEQPSSEPGYSGSDGAFTDMTELSTTFSEPFDWSGNAPPPMISDEPESTITSPYDDSDSYETTRPSASVHTTTEPDSESAPPTEPEEPSASVKPTTESTAVTQQPSTETRYTTAQTYPTDSFEPPSDDIPGVEESTRPAATTTRPENTTASTEQSTWVYPTEEPPLTEPSGNATESSAESFPSEADPAETESTTTTTETTTTTTTTTTHPNNPLPHIEFGFDMQLTSEQIRLLLELYIRGELPYYWQEYVEFYLAQLLTYL